MHRREQPAGAGAGQGSQRPEPQNEHRTVSPATQTARLQPDEMLLDHFGDFNNASLFDGFEQRDPVVSPPRDSPPHARTRTNEAVTLPDPLMEPLDSASASCCRDGIDSGTLIRQATSIVLCAREKHHLSQTGVNDVVAAIQEYQGVFGCLRATLQAHSSFTRARAKVNEPRRRSETRPDTERERGRSSLDRFTSNSLRAVVAGGAVMVFNEARKEAGGFAVCGGIRE
uniref:Uncharacterized protein n=1 Tax=Knipowitschia caucasica TaxID=637954 RepID=A0AAV2JYW4_KNICA